jgi:hypothetical protein
MVSRTGQQLAHIAQYESSVTAVCVHPSGTHLAAASKGGTLAVNQLTFAIVHALHRDCYAYRWDSVLP